jgi:RNA polymerase sigma factor (sigma-70 family)
MQPGPFRRKTPDFEALASQAEGQVYKTCFHMMGNAEDAMDCAQETMLRAYRAFASFRQEAQFSTWITRIAMNVCTDALRKRRPVVSLDALREDTGFDPPDGRRSAYAALEEKERLRLLREAMAALPDEARRLMDERMILTDDVIAVMNEVRATGEAILDQETGLLSARSRVGNATFWVKFTREGDDRYLVHRAYSHRMNVVRREG